MPSQAIRSSSLGGITGVRNNDTWTDGLPICKLSGVGMSANQIYREDGTPSYAHEYEDRSIHFCLDQHNNTFLYGVFDGHDGAKAAHFASQRMPAELSFEQLDGKTSTDEVREIFRDAFTAVENAFLESIDPRIAERTQILDKIPNEMMQFHAAQKYPEDFKRLQALEQEIRAGTAAVVALVHANTLYIGNVGDSRALLCMKDRSGVLRVKQLTVDHTTSSYDEMQRLQKLGLDTTKLEGAKLGNHEITRCIGNYFLKGGYKEFDMLSNATSDPVICEPYITQIPIDSSCSFLLLMSNGLCKSYQEATKSEQVNKEIAQMVAEQFKEQPTLTSVAQTVVDKVVRLHHDMYLTRQRDIITRNDITLIIRNFNFSLNCQPSSYLPPSASYGQYTRKKNPYPQGVSSSSSSDDLTLCEDTLGNQHDTDARLYASTQESADEALSSSYLPTDNTTSTESSELVNPSLTQFSLDGDNRIRPYVNFDLYYQSIEEAVAAKLIPDKDLHLYK